MQLSQRPARAAYFAVLLIASWCVMTVVHESGHIAAGGVPVEHSAKLMLLPGTYRTAASTRIPNRW